MFDWLRSWWQNFILTQWRKHYTVGGHCGLCGKWIPDAIVDIHWTWTLCEDSGEDGACFLTHSARGENDE